MIGHEQKIVCLFVARPAFLWSYCCNLSFHGLVCAACLCLLCGCYFQKAVFALYLLCLFHACTFSCLLVLQTRMEKFDRYHDSRFCFVRPSGDWHFGYTELWRIVVGLSAVLSQNPFLMFPRSRQEASHA